MHRGTILFMSKMYCHWYCLVKQVDVLYHLRPKILKTVCPLLSWTVLCCHGHILKVKNAVLTLTPPMKKLFFYKHACTHARARAHANTQNFNNIEVAGKADEGHYTFRMFWVQACHILALKRGFSCFKENHFLCLPTPTPNLLTSDVGYLPRHSHGKARNTGIAFSPPISLSVCLSLSLSVIFICFKSVYFLCDSLFELYLKHNPCKIVFEFEFSLSLCLSLSVCPSVRPSVCLSVCLSGPKCGLKQASNWLFTPYILEDLN